METFTDNVRKSFEINLSFGNFRDEEDFFDVTLAADSSNGSIEALRAHKLILSACSPVLRSLLKEQSRPDIYPIKHTSSIFRSFIQPCT